MNKTNKKTISLLLFLLVLVSTNLYAGLFDDQKTLTKETFDAIHAFEGLMLRLVILYLPYMLFFGGPLGTFVYHNRKADAEKEDKFKITIYVIASAFVGYVGGIILIYIIGMGMFPMHGGGDYALEVFSQFNATGVDGVDYSSGTTTSSQNSLLKN